MGNLSIALEMLVLGFHVRMSKGASAEEGSRDDDGTHLEGIGVEVRSFAVLVD